MSMLQDRSEELLGQPRIHLPHCFEQLFCDRSDAERTNMKKANFQYLTSWFC